MANRLLILACSATKTDATGPWVTAMQRYDGPLWKTLRAVDPESRLAQVAFLSAYLGFQPANTPVDKYDTRMTRSLADEMIRGGLGMRWPKTKPGTMGGMHAAATVTSLTDWGRNPLTEVCMVGGHLYLDVMRSFVNAFMKTGDVRPDARLVEINGAIGYMRRDLRQWLLEDQLAEAA